MQMTPMYNCASNKKWLKPSLGAFEQCNCSSVGALLEQLLEQFRSTLVAALHCNNNNCSIYIYIREGKSIIYDNGNAKYVCVYI